ncbi:MAG: aldo/keto reductase [Sphaerochaetaceae bacterium]|jgi:aryl-alcohol dehydrogenase-like predicted oxidoreductase
MKPEIALGTWEFGGGFGFWENQNRSDSLKTLHFAIRRGITSFDTAPTYGSGKSEQMLGQQLKRFPLQREKLCIASKTTNGKHLEQSLSRLCTSYLDVWYLHYPAKEQHEILERMAGRKEVKAVGVSNMPLALLQTLKDLPLRWVQVPCNLLWNKETEALKQYCGKHEIRISGYSPLAFGLLSGTHDDPPGDGRRNLYCYRHPEEFRALTALLRDIAKIHGTSPSQIAIAWSLRQGFDQIILGARTKTQLAEDLCALNLTLSPHEMELLEKASQAICSFIPEGQDNLFGHRWNHENAL